MNLKILNGEHSIMSADGEELGKTLFFYSHSRDAIVINNNYTHLDKLVELMETYLDLSDRSKKEAVERTENDVIRDWFAFLNRVARIRRMLYKSMRH